MLASTVIMRRNVQEICLKWNYKPFSNNKRGLLRKQIIQHWFKSWILHIEQRLWINIQGVFEIFASNSRIKKFTVNVTSSAILCLILRWTDALTWFCAETSSEENLEHNKTCMAHGKNVALTKQRYHRKYRKIQNAYKNSNNAQYKNHSHSALKIKNTTLKPQQQN